MTQLKTGKIPIQERLLVVTNVIDFYRAELRNWPDTLLVLPHIISGMCGKLTMELDSLGYRSDYTIEMAQEVYAPYFTRVNFESMFGDKINLIPGNEFYWTGRSKRDYIMRFLFLKWVKSKLIEEYENSKEDKANIH